MTNCLSSHSSHAPSQDVYRHVQTENTWSTCRPFHILQVLDTGRARHGHGMGTGRVLPCLTTKRSGPAWPGHVLYKAKVPECQLLQQFRDLI